MAKATTTTRVIMSMDDIAAAAVKRGRPTIVDGKIVDALAGLEPGTGANFSDVFGSVDVTLKADELQKAKGKIRESIRKHFAVAYPGEKASVRWLPNGEPLVGRP